jgi:beta-glucosidase
MDVVNIRLEAGRQYDLRMEYYENEGWSYASLGWQLKSQTDPKVDAAVKAAHSSDAAIVAVGITEGEGYDRANLDLPVSEEHLIRAIAETGKPTIVVLLNGSAITMKNWIDTVAAVVEAWYPGEEGGNAIADVLFGDYNPGGKLPLTFPKFVGQVPLYYDTKPTGRGYDYSDMSGGPLFPFGHGLSYTSFSYSNLVIEPATVPIGKKVRIRCELQNQGNRRGDEVVQLYLHDPVASVTRPLKQLRGFQRVMLEPNQKTTVTFEIGNDELEFLDEKMKPIIEPGAIEVLLGSSSEDIRLRSNFELIAR